MKSNIKDDDDEVQDTPTTKRGRRGGQKTRASQPTVSQPTVSECPASQPEELIKQLDIEEVTPEVRALLEGLIKKHGIWKVTPWIKEILEEAVQVDAKVKSYQTDDDKKLKPNMTKILNVKTL